MNEEEEAWQPDEEEKTLENPKQVLEECITKFSTQDCIMEPSIFYQLKRYVIEKSKQLIVLK